MIHGICRGEASHGIIRTRWLFVRCFAPTSRILSALVMILMGALIAGCTALAPVAAPTPTAHPMAHMPEEVRAARVEVQQAYQFAEANPHIMQQLPCYCNCAQFGHRNIYQCYVKAVDDKGKVEYDLHAVGCTICVDITQDAMRMRGAGKSVAEMKAYIDATYSKYGPSNMPN